MDFGAVFPTTQIGSDPAVIRDFAQTAEGLGIRRLSVYDHVPRAVHADRDPPLTGPYTQDDPFHEPLVLLGFLAACTTTIELEVAVLVLPQRQTVLVAKQTAEVDVLSGGRLLLAVGSGWNYVEYEGLGMPFGDRGRRFYYRFTSCASSGASPWSITAARFTASTGPAGARYHPGARFPCGSAAVLKPRCDAPRARVKASCSAPPGHETHVRSARLHELLARRAGMCRAFPMEAMIDYSLAPRFWADEVPDWQERGGTMLSIRTMSTGAGHHGIPRTDLGTPAAHIAALGEFAQVVHGA